MHVMSEVGVTKTLTQFAEREADANSSSGALLLDAGR